MCVKMFIAASLRGNMHVSFTGARSTRVLRQSLCNEIRAQVCCYLVEVSLLTFYIYLKPVTQTWRGLVKIATVLLLLLLELMLDNYNDRKRFS